jgi:fatty-acyl-CoA synthase
MPDALSYEPLTPLSFLRRSGMVFADRTAVVDGELRFTYGQLLERSERLAGGLRSMGIADGERVAVLAPNTHVLLEAHYGVPLAGGSLVALNYRLSAAELAYILDHSGAEVLIADHGARDLAVRILEGLGTPPAVVWAGGRADDYEALTTGSERLLAWPADEMSMISLNYTSGTTGRPKGVMYHHRGAYLQSLAMAYHLKLDPGSVFLWTLPMFHCNGWCCTWAVTAAGGVHLCLPKPDPADIWRLIRDEGVTHLNAAPTVLTGMCTHPAAGRLERPLQVATGGAPPSPAMLARLDALNIDVTHLYGLTETMGPAVICEWRPEWSGLGAAPQAELRARQGVPNVVSHPFRVIDKAGGALPPDGVSPGEVVIRGNNVMLGYLHEETATRESAPDGWFRTGDLGIVHPDGYLELRDRLKDVIISGGENIASVEVEQVISSHPDVLEVAVVGAPHERWGEVPVAFVTLRTGADLDEAALVEHVRSRLAGFKTPKQIVFGPLPKTATGKVQKFRLRETAREVSAASPSRGG